MSKLQAIKKDEKLYSLEIPYSETEHCIGEWIDGKKMYRKIIKTTVPSTSTSGTAVYGQTVIPNVSFGMVKDCLMKLTTNTGTSYQSIQHFASGNDSSLYLRAYFTIAKSNNNGILEIVNNATWWNGNEIIAIVEYTKTID